jgi:hypothetical protein
MMMVISLLMLMYTTVCRIGSVYKEHVIRNRVIADLISLSAAIEKYREIHGDYPRVLNSTAGEENNKILCEALRGNVNPFGIAISNDPINVDPNDRKKVNLVPAKIDEVGSEGNRKFIDQFGNDYLYYYATRDDINNVLWLRHSFVLVSKGVDGVKTVNIDDDGTVSQNKGDDMVVDNTGML